jgi:hypothetical protein
MAREESALVVLDADVLCLERTGDDTYIRNLLRDLSGVEAGFELAVVTCRRDVVRDGIPAVELRARNQPVRMAVQLPLLLRRLHPALSSV